MANDQGKRRRKIVLLAVLLQCIPLIGASSCIAAGVSAPDANCVGSCSGSENFPAPVLASFTLLCWGWGYVYLRAGEIRLLSTLCGPLFALSSCFAIAGVSHGTDDWLWDCTIVEVVLPQLVMHPFHLVFPVTFGNCSLGSIELGAVVATAVFLMAFDAWRLAVAHNAAVAGGQGSANGD